MFELDLRETALQNSEFFDRLKRISYNQKGEFNDLIAKASKSFHNNLDWWVEKPVSRNTLSSTLFFRFCCLHLVIDLIQSGKTIKKVTIDSPAMFCLIRDLRNVKIE